MDATRQKGEVVVMEMVNIGHACLIVWGAAFVVAACAVIFAKKG